MEKTFWEILKNLPPEKIFQTMPSGLFLVDKSQKILHWNAAAERVTGYTSSEVIGRNCSFLECTACQDGICPIFNVSIKKPATGIDCYIKDKDGNRVRLLKNCDVLRNNAGEIIGGMESFIDITHQEKLAEQLRQQTADLEKTVAERTAALEKEKNRFRTVLDSMTDFASIFTQDHRIAYMNQAGKEAIGDHVGNYCYKAFFNREKPCSCCLMPHVVSGGATCCECLMPQFNRTYEVIHTPLLSPTGQMEKLAVMRDITERKETQKKLQDANRELDAFVSTVSHDLRAPLTPIMGYAGLLKAEYGEKLDKRGLNALNEIEEQASKLLRHLEDLLVLARVGKVKRPPKPVDVTMIVQKVLAEFNNGIAQRQTAIEIKPLHPIALPATLLSQIFSNLLGNAIRYAGDSESPIQIGSENHTEKIRYFVRDHGPGIPEKEREHIFDLFYRGSATKKIEGTGIGLATVRKIAHLYDGRVWVDETPGGGSTFWVEFPIGCEKQS